MAANHKGHAIFSSIEQVKREHTEHGGHFFDADTLRFFSSRVLPTLHGPRHNVFVTSERFGNDPRHYSVRVAEWQTWADGSRFLSVDTVAGGFTDDYDGYVFPDRESAVKFAQEYARDLAVPAGEEDA